MHIPIVNNNPVDEDRVALREREGNGAFSGGSAVTTVIHKTPAEAFDRHKMYANEKRSQNNSGAAAVNSAGGVANKSHILASNNKNIKNNQMNNQKINKASYLDAVSSVNESNAKNNNIEKNLNNKFEVQKVKKKDGFLSRISSGLRFSFRGKKSPKAGAVYNYNQFEGPAPQDLTKKQNLKMRQNNQDIVFIPLKDPTTENVQSFLQHEMDHAHLATNNNHMLNGTKPPVPSKPPRPFVAGRPPIHPKSSHAHRGGSLSPPLRDTEQHAYHDYVPQNQLRAATLSGNTSANPYDFDDNSFKMGSEQKIGLIETNLDTHETIITGKTQSLMELGGPQSYGPRKGHTLAGPVSRAISSSKANKTIIGNSHHKNALEIDSADASNGRPHKSMEFLLDKENHQQVLVSLQFFSYLIYVV